MSFRLQVCNSTYDILHHHFFPNDFVKSFKTVLTDCISSVATAKNARLANACGTNKLLGKSSLAIVISAHDVAYWMQPVKYFPQNHYSLFLSTIDKSYRIVFKKQDARCCSKDQLVQKLSKTCIV